MRATTRHALELSLRLLKHAESGAHYCRGCDAGTHNKWQHTPTCSHDIYNREVDAARDLIRAELTEPDSK